MSVLLEDLVQAPEATEASARTVSGRVSFAVTTSNIKSVPLMPQGHVTHDVNKVMHLAGVNMFQEIEPDRYKHAVTNAANANHKHVYGLGTECPIAVPGDFHVDANNARVASRSMPHVQNTRHIVEVSCHKGGMPFSFFNTHTVSKPFRHPAHSHQAFRNEEWRKHLALFSQILRAQPANKCLVYGGDMNNPVNVLNHVNHGPLHPRGVLVATGGIDHIWVVPPRGKHVVVVGRHAMRGFSDHAAYHASIAIV